MRFIQKNFAKENSSHSHFLDDHKDKKIWIWHILRDSNLFKLSQHKSHHILIWEWSNNPFPDLLLRQSISYEIAAFRRTLIAYSVIFSGSGRTTDTEDCLKASNQPWR